MVHRLVVSYGQPDDPGAFDAHYRDTHVPLATAMPGLVRFTVGHPVPVDPSELPPYLVAELDFASEEDMAQAFASPEGAAAAADVGTFASGGATMVHFEVHEVPAGTTSRP
ncbi:EthD family reductase [Geodermatophilus sp. TF02-6]|uniref:EthD family reductase n=1 Tax=Geodermatophilus sp. TF02-6 TaxID=2250575 RepID=UPI000DEB2C7C|nr:EthD family reductase [Geodermatophilus sp. TF02-6]RBY74884.1 EthD family reductase [Geodermatophilus sp. TF02-6]